MMSFLHPVLGLAALAVAIPIALHLMRRREARRTTFPAVRYLRQAEQRHAQRLRLRYLLLLAARLLIVLLLALAAMGPLLGHGGPADHRPTALAIVIDESQSASRTLGDRQLLDLYAERAQATLDLAAADDRIALFSAVRPDEAAIAHGAATVREYLMNLRAAAALADLQGAIRQAAAWLGSETERAREIHVFTDLQRVSLTAGAISSTDEPAQAGRSISVAVYVPDLAPSGNGAVGEAEPEVTPLTAGVETRVSVPLHWFGSEMPAGSRLVRLVKGDGAIAMAEAAFRASALLTLPPQDSGWVQGYIEIDRPTRPHSRRPALLHMARSAHTPRRQDRRPDRLPRPRPRRPGTRWPGQAGTAGRRPGLASRRRGAPRRWASGRPVRHRHPARQPSRPSALEFSTRPGPDTLELRVRRTTRSCASGGSDGSRRARRP